MKNVFLALDQKVELYANHAQNTVATVCNVVMAAAILSAMEDVVTKATMEGARATSGFPSLTIFSPNVSWNVHTGRTGMPPEIAQHAPVASILSAISAVPKALLKIPQFLPVAQINVGNTANLDALRRVIVLRASPAMLGKITNKSGPIAIRSFQSFHIVRPMA